MRQTIQSLFLLILYEYGAWALQCSALTKFVSLDQLRLFS